MLCTSAFMPTACIHISGMLSKSKGQVLRISAAFHVLFHVKKGNNTTDGDNEIDKDNNTDHEDEDDEHENNDDEHKDKDDNDYDNAQTNTPICSEISEQAVAAAINFVQLCCQQAAFIAGRGDIEEEIQIVNASKFAIRVHSTSYCYREIFHRPY